MFSRSRSYNFDHSYELPLFLEFRREMTKMECRFKHRNLNSKNAKLSIRSM